MSDLKYYGIKSAPYITLAKTRGGIFLELGISLEGVVADKDIAIKEGRYEEAARYREKEVGIIKQIETLLSTDK